MINMQSYVCFFCFFGLTGTLLAQPTKSFPAHLIDTSIINQRGLHDQIDMLKNECNWSERKGGKIDVFWAKLSEGNFFGTVYEYIMDCDNLRLIYWHYGTPDTGPLVDFMIENVEDESQFVVRKKQQLKRRKGYQKYFTP